MADDVFRKGSASAPRGYFRWEAAGLAWLGDAPGGGGRGAGARRWGRTTSTCVG